MADTSVSTVYFGGKGAEYTDQALALAKARCEALGIRSVVVASTRGDTGARAAEVFRGYNLVVVTHSAGFKDPDAQELTPANAEAIRSRGGKILTTQHAFGGIGRAIRRKFNTYQTGEIIAAVYRTLSQGMKVVAEISLMAADAGLISTREEIMAIAGSGRGADTAVVLRPANSQDFFDLKILEVVCKPREP